MGRGNQFKQARQNRCVMAYHRVLLAMVTYPMAITTMTTQDMEDMQVVMDRTYKTNMHLNRHFPNAVYRGTERYGGLNISPLSTHQGYKHIQLLIGSMRNGDSGGDLAIQSLEYSQLEGGTSTSILHPVQGEPREKWLQKTWLTSIRKTLLDCDGKINIQKEWIPPLQRQNDKYIMEEFAKKYKKEKLLKQLNRCRMNLQAITLSDITTSTGKQLCPFAIKGERHPHRPSTYKWPNQTRIAPKYWNIWTTCVKDTFCSNQTKLKSPLKDWIQGAEESQHWQTFADHD